MSNNLKNIINDYKNIFQDKIPIYIDDALIMIVLITKDWPFVLADIKKYLLVNPDKIMKTDALIYASKYSKNYSSNQTVKLLIDMGVDINRQNEKGRTALHYAVKGALSISNFETIQILVEANANINLTDHYGYTPLVISFLFLSKIDLGFVKLLMNDKTDLNLIDSEGNNILMKYIGYNYSESEPSELILIFKFILNTGIRNDLVNKYGNTWINSFLIQNMNMESKYILEFLQINYQLSGNINFNILNDDHCTSIMIIMDNYSIKYDDSIKFLIESGVDLNLQNSDGKTSLMMAIERNITLDIIKLMIDKSDLNIVDTNGNTALIIATYKTFNFPLIKMLVDANVNIDIQNTLGKTAIIYSAESKMFIAEKITLFLIKSGGDIRIIKNFDPFTYKYYKIKIQNELLLSKINEIEENIKYHPDSEFVKWIKDEFDVLKNKSDIKKN